MRLLAALVLLLFIGFSRSDDDGAGGLPFSVSLTEQKSKEDTTGSRYLTVTGFMSCHDPEDEQDPSQNTCDYNITVVNDAVDNGFPEVLVNGQACPGNVCRGSLTDPEAVFVTVHKAGGLHLDLIRLHYTPSRVIVLGCETDGLILKDTCSTIRKTYDDQDYGYDEVCACTTQFNCAEIVKSGPCINDEPTWWVADADSTSSSVSTPHSTTTQGSSTPTSATSTIASTTTDSTVNFNFGVSLTETNNSDPSESAGKITVTVTMVCTETECRYTATTNPTDYFGAEVNGETCPHPCHGSFDKGDSNHVILRRLGQHLDLVQLSYFDTPEVVILGCHSGLLKPNTCLRIEESPYVGTASYHDVLCSCQDKTVNCDGEIARCDRGDINWWENDAESTSTSVSTSTSTSPPNPNTFDLSFLLEEGQMGANPSASVRINAFMNCSETDCQYTVQIADYQQTYFTIKVADEECPESRCTGSFPFGKTVRVTASRLSETLDVFDLAYVSEPTVLVIGCSEGFVNKGLCVMTSGFDSNVQLDTSLCICSDTIMNCDSNTALGQCSSGAPIWWAPDSELHSTSTTEVTTTTRDYDMTFMITLSENNVNGDQDSFKSLKAEVVLVCEPEHCRYQITLTTDSPQYFTVLVGGLKCGDYCDSSFTSVETRSVQVFRKGEVLDWFDLKFRSIEVLGCSDGYFDETDCMKMENQEKNLAETVCTCNGNDDRCSEADVGKCSTGDPVWWKPDPNAVVTTTLSPVIYSKRTVLSLSEQDASLDTKPIHTLLVTVSMNCTQYICTFKAVIPDVDDYFNVRLDGVECFTTCLDYLNPGEVKVLTANRQNEHLNLVEFHFDDPGMVVVGCSDVESSTNGELGEYDLNECFMLANSGIVDALHYDDQLCVCEGTGTNTCDVNTPRGECKAGTFTWWESDTTSTSSAATTTTADMNYFAMEITLTEKTKNTGDVLQEITISSSMKCTLEVCSYEIGHGPFDENYFEVFIGNEPYSKASHQGSFMKGQSVNVTLRRASQFLSLFDYEFVDIARVVILTCEDGLSENGHCIKSTQDVQIDGIEYFDEVCSCRSAGVQVCDDDSEGVCRMGHPKWWRDVDESTSTSTSTQMTSERSSSVSTSTVISTTPEAIPALKDLSDNGVDLSNVTQVLNDTLHYSSQGASLNGTQVFEITKVLHKSANLADITAENAVQILRNMDECLNAHEDEIRRGQTEEMRLLDVLKPMVRNSVANVIHFLDGQNMGFGAKRVDCSNIDSDDGLIDYGPEIGFRSLNDTNRLSATQQNSIIVPLRQVCGNQEVTHVFFTIYRHQKLFTGNQTYRVYGSDSSDTQDDGDLDGKGRRRFRRDADINDTSLPLPAPGRCESQISIPQQASVLSAVLLDKEGGMIQRLKVDGDATPAIMATVQFNVGKMPIPLHAKTIVSWFDTALNIWSEQNQCAVRSVKDGIVQADCEHLTDFSALIQGQINSECVCSEPLIILGFIVNGVSLSCLLFLIAVGSFYYVQGANTSKLLIWIRGHVPPKGDIVNLTYYSIFFLFFILSMFFMDQTKHEESYGESSNYCVAIAAVSYFCLISAILMSMLIGIRMVCHFFPPKLRVFFRVMTSPPAALSIGLVTPMCLTLALVFFDTSFFKRNDAFCWIRPDYTTYAVVIPVVLPIVNGLVCSTFAIYKMFFQAKRGLASKETKHHDAEFWSKVLGLIIMQVAMGLPWGIEFIIIGLSGPSPWNYVFVVMFGTQGIDLFLIFLYRRHRLVSESKKWSAREQRLDASRESDLTQRKETRAATFMEQS